MVEDLSGVAVGMATVTIMLTTMADTGVTVGNDDLGFVG